MNVLLLVIDQQRINLDQFYGAIIEEAEAGEVRRLSSAEQSNLRRYFSANVDVERFDRIVLMLRFKLIRKQVRFLRAIPNLVLIEHDACQNYMEGKYKGEFSHFYKKMPWVRVLVSGFNVAQKLKAEGVDACFVPKGYDSEALYNSKSKRDIELGFVGSLAHDAYKDRRILLEELSAKEDLVIARTNTKEKYLAVLNRIEKFVSADAGIGEYMAKNFEAMACGCLLLAWDQGESENKALGFVDMKNVVLYSGISDLMNKLSKLREDNVLAHSVADAGSVLARDYYAWPVLGKRAVEEMAKPLKEKPDEQFWFLDWLRR
ncbi:glycosyltransferase [Aestuariirhabdus sp. LZHN29]|uniref:glycosyltransferase n=1 Tax=Aestuariirhabdus sp. LZHN29 TaxID=3417462 RepID=UPI003CF33841